MAERFLVVGAGGIGGVVAATLTEQGHDVTTLTRNPVICDAINAHGFRVRGEGAPGTVPGKAVRSLSKSSAPFDFILLATQPPQVEEAAREVREALRDDGNVVCFQNGLCEERLAKIVGPERVIGAVVAWGASMVEPGVYDRTSAGGFQIGRWTATDRTAVSALSAALESVGPVTVTDNLPGARWSKLAINCAISSLGTLGGERLGVLMRHRFVRRLALEIMTEVVAVARAEEVRLEKVSGTIDLDSIALTEEERRAPIGSAGLVAKHALLLAVGARYRRLRSSMLSAMERGRPPAVDFLNGEVVTRGAAHGIPTPVNSAIQTAIHGIFQGRDKSSEETLRNFYETTRAALARSEQADLPPPSMAPPADPKP